jgi:hypothetical protein
LLDLFAWEHSCVSLVGAKHLDLLDEITNWLKYGVHHKKKS